MSIKSNYRDGDYFSKKSKKEGYRSRASYKLKEILKTDIYINGIERYLCLVSLITETLLLRFYFQTSYFNYLK